MMAKFTITKWVTVEEAKHPQKTYDVPRSTLQTMQTQVAIRSDTDTDTAHVIYTEHVFYSRSLCY